MNPSHTPVALLWIFAVVLSALLTQVVIIVAQKFSLVAKPKADRWHATPTALYGGVAIVVSFLLTSACVLAQNRFLHSYELLGLFAGGIFLFALGVRDDAVPLNPLVKLLGQVMAVTPFLVGMALTHTSPVYIIALPAVLLWMVALTNAFNLLDNMNGLSAGTAAVVGGVLAAYSFLHGELVYGLLSALLSASCLGFLFFNCRFATPARIFMGDCGSMFLGYMLAGLTVIGVCRPLTSPLPSLTVPLLLMALPIFDTLLVIIRRKREGRAISQGGKDHSSHRLVYSGLTPKQAVFGLYFLSILTGGVGLLCERLQMLLLLPLSVAGIAIGLWFFGSYLSRFTSPQSGVSPAPLRETQLDTNPT